MTMPSSRIAFGFAALAAATVIAPITASFADSMTSPNAINNSTVDRDMAQQSISGVYDNCDQYRDAKGFPQPGWRYLVFPPH